MSGDRLALDRLWPMLLGLAALVLGALALEGYARGRRAETVTIAIHDEAAPAGDDDDGDDGGDPEAAPVSPLHARARLAAKRGLLDEAIPLYEKALAERPGLAVLEAELGGYLLAAGAPEKALPRLVRADRAAPSHLTAHRLGLARLRTGDREGAERELRRALALRPGHGAARVALGSLLRRRGALEEAIRELESASSSGSNEERARALAALGGALLDAGRPADAARAFDRAVELAPARAEIRLAVARAWLGGGDRAGAERADAALRKAADLAPDLPAVFALQGRVRERLSDPRGAEEAYDRAIRLDPAHRPARRRLLRLALAQRDFARARHEAERLLADAPEVPEHHFLAALVADRDGRDAQARAGYRKAIEVAGGDYPEAWLNLGVLEKGAKDPAAARAAYARALALRPAYAAAHLNLAKLEESERRPAQAEAAYRRAVAIDPSHAAAWLSLGQLLSGQRRHEEALAALRRAIEARPGYDAAELSLGVALVRAGRVDEAIAAYRALLARAPRHASAWYDLALALDRKGAPEAEVREALGRAIAVDADHLPSLRRLAELDLRGRRLPEARAGFQEILDRAPQDVGARAALAELAALAGDPARCEAEARRLRHEAPADSRARDLAARCAAARAAAPP